MRRRILLSLMTIAVVATIIGIGSWAVFNDTETAGPYTATAGSLDLDVGSSEAVSTQIEDLKPSVWHYLGPFWVHNSGENAGGLDFHFMNVVDGPGLQTEPECDATWGGLVNGECVGEAFVDVDDISNWIDVDYWITGPYAAQPNPTFVACEGGSILGTLADIESRTFDPGIQMQTSQWYGVCFSFHLQKDAGNEYQGDTSTFDIEFTLHQLNQPAARNTVRLDNKTEAGPDGVVGTPDDWGMIGDDDTYGSATYQVLPSGDLEIQVRVNGLTPNKWHQLTLQGPGPCTDTDDQLASGSEQYAAYDSGFWDGPSFIHQNPCGGTPGLGVYNYAYIQTDASGDYIDTIIVTNSGEVDPAEAGKVSPAMLALPVGVYSDVSFIVKEIGGASPPDTSWTPVLEPYRNMDFNLP